MAEYRLTPSRIMLLLIIELRLHFHWANRFEFQTWEPNRLIDIITIKGRVALCGYVLFHAC